MSQPAIAAIVGPTASGKSTLALAVAARLPVEIISADSRQVYRGMDIGTAKPSRAERRRVAHHLIDIVAPDEPFTVVDWVTRVRPLIHEIAARGRLPLVVGGTGLYVSALVDGFDFDAQPWSPELRARLAAELEADGLPSLASRLARLAPMVATRTDLRNPRRVLRALERAESGNLELPRSTPYGGPVRLLGIERPRDVLTGRIERRARDMFSAGILDETQALLDAGYARDLPSLSGHGYQEAAEVLGGVIDQEQAIETTSRRVRQYARRQVTWFGRDRRVMWLPAADRAPGDRALVDAAIELLRTSS